jgi:hypothetical protein
MSYVFLDLVIDILELRSQASCHLEDCLAEYTKLEMLNDCICRKCSMKATHQKLRQEADRLVAAVNADPTASISKKKRVKDARKLELRVQTALDHGRLEEDVKGVKLEKVFSRASTKQAMIARVSLSFLCAPESLRCSAATSSSRTASQSIPQLRPLCC